MDIFISKKKRMVYLDQTSIGNERENLQEVLVFRFLDKFVDGTARVEYSIGKEKRYAMPTKVGETYVLPVLSEILTEGKVFMQLVVTEGTDENEIPVFKSNVFYLTCEASINAEIEQEQTYPQWIDIANTKLNALDEAISHAEEIAEEVQRKAESGEFDGKDALINGYNTITISGGENITLTQEGENFIIDYDDSEIKQEINNLDIEVEGLTENINEIVRTKADKTELPKKVSELENDKNFIDNLVNDLKNYYLKTETYTKEEVDTKISQIETIKLRKVDVLPETGEPNTIYLVPKETTKEQNIFEEYIYVDNKWEMIGTTEIDLSNYPTFDEMNLAISQAIESAKYVAGENITIEGNVISALAGISFKVVDGVLIITGGDNE